MKTTLLALAGAMTLAAGASLAQPPAPPAPGERHAMHERPDPAAMAERHAQRLRDVLQLRPEQEPALRAFVGALAPPERGGRAPGQREALGQLTTPERLDRMRARMADRQARFERRADATKRFYAQLSPAQQRAFDALKPMGGGHGGHHGEGRMGGRHGHGEMGGFGA